MQWLKMIYHNIHIWLGSIFIVLALLMVFNTVNVGAGIVTCWDGIMYVTEDQITIAWDPVENAAWYEVQALWIDPSSGPVVYNLGKTTNTQMVITKIRSGHFVLAVRACNDVGCSEWSRTDDETKTQDNKAIRIYFKLPAPSGATVE